MLENTFLPSRLWQKLDKFLCKRERVKPNRWNWLFHVINKSGVTVKSVLNRVYGTPNAYRSRLVAVQRLKISRNEKSTVTGDDDEEDAVSDGRESCSGSRGFSRYPLSPSISHLSWLLPLPPLPLRLPRRNTGGDFSLSSLSFQPQVSFHRETRLATRFKILLSFVMAGEVHLQGYCWEQ